MSTAATGASNGDEVELDFAISSPAPPVAPTITATPGNSTVTITWKDVPGATTYNLYSSTVPGVSVTNGSKVASIISPYTSTNLKNATTYYYVATAVDSSGGESLVSAEVSAAPSATPAPAAPVITAIPGNTQVIIQPEASAGGLILQPLPLAESGIAHFQRHMDYRNLIPPYDYVDSGLTNGKHYYYVATAVGNKESTGSSPIQATPWAGIAPGAPVLTATPGDAQVTIAWKAVPGATSYNLYWSTEPRVAISAGNKIRSPGATAPGPGVDDYVYVRTGLTDGLRYYYAATAVDANGNESVASAAVSAVPSATPAPAAPVICAAPGPADASITITWKGVPGATSYNLYRLTEPTLAVPMSRDSPGVKVPKNKDDNYNYVQAGLADGTRYYYVATAVDPNGNESVPSAAVSAIPSTAPAPAAPGITATPGPGDGRVTIDWKTVPGATSYDLYWSMKSGVTPENGNKIANIKAPPYVHWGLFEGTAYYYVLTATKESKDYASRQVAVGPTESVASAEVSAVPAANHEREAPTVNIRTLERGSSYFVYLNRWALQPYPSPFVVAGTLGDYLPGLHFGLFNAYSYDLDTSEFAILPAQVAFGYRIYLSRFFYLGINYAFFLSVAPNSANIQNWSISALTVAFLVDFNNYFSVGMGLDNTVRHVLRVIVSVSPDLIGAVGKQ